MCIMQYVYYATCILCIMYIMQYIYYAYTTEVSSCSSRPHNKLFCKIHYLTA